MVEFYHYLFYRASNYYKDKNLPVYSPVILITFILSLNTSMIYESISYFLYHNRWTWEHPWAYYVPIVTLFVFNYWYFSKNARWKSVIKWGDKMPCTEKRERNIYYWLYIAFTILTMVFVAYASMNNICLYPDRVTLPANVHINQEEGVIIYKPDL